MPPRRSRPLSLWVPTLPQRWQPYRRSTRSLDVTGASASAHITVRLLLAKNPAGWQQALAMVDKQAGGVVIAVNGRVPDGEDLSWLWDVHFEHFAHTSVVAIWRAGHRPGGPVDVCRVPHAGTRPSRGHRVMPTGAGGGRRQLHRVLQLQRKLVRLK